MTDGCYIFVIKARIIYPQTHYSVFSILSSIEALQKGFVHFPSFTFSLISSVSLLRSVCKTKKRGKENISVYWKLFLISLLLHNYKKSFRNALYMASFVKSSAKTYLKLH